jgi:hypothetical protein
VGQRHLLIQKSVWTKFYYFSKEVLLEELIYETENLKKEIILGLRVCSVGKHLPRRHKALGSIPSTEKKRDIVLKTSGQNL